MNTIPLLGHSTFTETPNIKLTYLPEMNTSQDIGSKDVLASIYNPNKQEYKMGIESPRKVWLT